MALDVLWKQRQLCSVALNFKVALQGLAKMWARWLECRDPFHPKNRTLADPCVSFLSIWAVEGRCRL